MRRHSFTLAILFVIALLLIACFNQVARAQGTGAKRKPGAVVPAPREMLGFTPGDERTIADWRQITGYFTALDKASDRVTLQTLGFSTLRRPLIAAFISAPENIRELAKYQAIERKLADPRGVSTDAERDALIRDGKTIVVISCSIHSDEIVASQMSMQLAYELATAEDAEAREILQNTILILIPSPNPDGIDIIADWYRKTIGTPFEGTEPPELYHHYAGHDDNRDWFMLNLRETQLITRLLWREWFPQIVYDIHQQGQNASRLFVPPFFDPANPHIAPVLLRQVGLIGSKMAADLQAAGFQGVLTNAVYDTWWHGGFRTAPYYHNSIGILSEAASARLMTPARVSRAQLAEYKTRGLANALESATNFPSPWRGGMWYPRDIMAMEMTAARSLLSLAAKYRADYLRNFYELGRSAVNFTPQHGAPLAYLIPAGQGRDEAVAKLIGILVAQGIEVQRLDKELHVGGATGDYIVTEPSLSGQEAPASSYIVFLAQPSRANVQALFEPQVYPNRRTGTGEAERPYDVTGWTLPMQMGIEVQPITHIVEPPEQRRLTLIHDEAEVRRDLGLALKQGEASPIPSPLKRAVRLAIYKSYVENIDEGWTRWLFDTFNVPYESLTDRDVRRGDLRARFDVIILPSERDAQIVEGNAQGSFPAEFTGGITEAGVLNLRRFVEAGGTLICFDAASEFAIKRFNLPLMNAVNGLKPTDFYCPGSILRLSVDTANPLARGLRKDVDAYFINSSAFDITDPQRVRVVARYADKNVLRSGWLLGEKHIAGKAALVEVPLGQGRIILFAFRPQHRGQTWGTFPFIFNAIASGVQ